MPATQHHTEYAPPVLRAPSPASSIGTSYGEDQTSLSDSEEQLNQAAFEKKCEERFPLGVARPEELLADEEPLLFRHPVGSKEEKELFQQTLMRLREAVQALEEDDIFEMTLLRSSQVPSEPIPSTSDIDDLMRSMMVTPQPSTNLAQDLDSVGGPSRGRNGTATNGACATGGYDQDNNTPSTKINTAITPGKRSRNGTRRN